MDHDTSLAGVEPEGVPATSVLGMVLAIMVMLAVVVAAGVEIALGEFDTAGALATEATGYPVLRETRAAAQELLTQPGVVDAEAGIYRIPIQQAMALVVQEAAAGTTGEITLVP